MAAFDIEPIECYQHTQYVEYMYSFLMHAMQNSMKLKGCETGKRL